MLHDIASNMASIKEGIKPLVVNPGLQESTSSITIALPIVRVTIPKPTTQNIPRVAMLAKRVNIQPKKNPTMRIAKDERTAEVKLLTYTPFNICAETNSTIGVIASFIKNSVISLL